MKKKPNKLSISETIEEIENAKILAKQEEVNKILEQTYFSSEGNEQLKYYKKIKAMKWWSYLIALTIAIILTGISLIVFYTTNNSRVLNYVNIGIILLMLITIVVINYVKNNSAAKYFNDKKRRYQRTLTDEEAKVFLTLKILFLGLILFLPTLISFAVIYS